MASTVLLVCPWTAQGLTTQSVYLGRMLEGMGYRVLYHAWRGIYDPPGFSEDASAHRGEFASLPLDDIDVAVWCELADASQVDLCRKHGVRTVWGPNWEFIDKPNPDKDVQFDIIACPSQHTFNVLSARDTWPRQSLHLCRWWCDFPITVPRPTPEMPTFYHCVRGVSGDIRNTTALLRGWRLFKKHGGVGTLRIKSLAPLAAFIKDYSPQRDVEVIEGKIPFAEVLALYRDADCFVYPTKREGVGLVLLEALRAGLPILVTDSPPMNEWRSGDNGLALPVREIVPVKNGTHAMVDPEALAAILFWCTPQRIDVMKVDIASGWDERERAFRDFWQGVVA